MSFLLGGAYNVDSEARVSCVRETKTAWTAVFRAWAVGVLAHM